MTDNTLILYTTSDGQASVVLRELGGQLWLTQAEMAELYQTSKQNISKHITAVLEEGELLEKAVVNSQLTTAADGEKLSNTNLRTADDYRHRLPRALRSWYAVSPMGHAHLGRVSAKRLRH